MSTAVAAVASISVLALAGGVPAVAAAGLQWPALPLAVLGGAVLAGAAAAGSVAFGGDLLPWFVALALAVAAVSVLIRRGHDRNRHPDRERHQGQPDCWRPRSTAARSPAVTGIAAVAILGALTWSLRALGTPTVGFDARAIWLLHAHWYAAGHQVALAAIRNGNLSLTHASYPPLVSASVAIAWLVTGDQGDRLGVVVVAVLNASAVAVAAWSVVEASRRALATAGGTERLRAGSAASPRPGDGRWNLPYPVALGIVAAAALALVTFGVAGTFATDGYADLLWASAAVGAIAWGLVLGECPGDLPTAAVLVGVAALTKDEGTATAAAIIVLIAARLAWRRRGHEGDPERWRRVATPVGAGIGGVVLTGLWPLLMRIEHASADSNTTGARMGSAAARARATFDAMAPHLHVLELALPLAAVAWIFLRPGRRLARLGNDAWAWAGLGSGLAFVAGAYVTGPGNIAFWLATSVDRTAIFPALCAWWIVAFWIIVGAASPDFHRPRPVGPAVTGQVPTGPVQGVAP